MPSENIELGSEDQRTKMPKVNATPRIREALIGIGLLCGFMIFHSGTSSENIKGEISKEHELKLRGPSTDVAHTNVLHLALISVVTNIPYKIWFQR